STKYPSPRQNARVGILLRARGTDRANVRNSDIPILANVSPANTKPNRSLVPPVILWAKIRRRSRSQPQPTKSERGLCDEKINTPPCLRTRWHSRKHC